MGSVLKETIVVSVTISASVHNRHSRIPLRALPSTWQNERNASRTRSPRGKSPSGRMFRLPCKAYLKGPCTNSFCKNGILQYVCSTRPRVVADLEKSACMHLARLMNSLAKGLKRMVTKVQWLWVKRNEQPQRTRRPVLDAYSTSTRQLGCVFHDMEPPKSSSILRKSSDMRKPIRRVKFVKAIARHTKIRDQNPSLGLICPSEPHQRGPNAPKFEDQSQEETEWQEQGAREAAWKLAKNVFKLKEHERATFFSPSESRCLPASTLKLEEREICCRLRSVDAYDQQKGLEFY